MFGTNEGKTADTEPLTSRLQSKGKESGYEAIPRRSSSSSFSFPWSGLGSSFIRTRSQRRSVIYQAISESQAVYNDLPHESDEEEQVAQPPIEKGRRRTLKGITQSMTSRASKNKEERKKFENKFEEKRHSFDIQLGEVLIMFAIYLSVAVIAYSWTFEDWSVVDSLYFAVTTFTTVGTGDVYPSHPFSILFTSFFVLTGVTFVGMGMGVLGSNLVESEAKAVAVGEEVVQHRLTNLFSPAIDEFDDINVQNMFLSDQEDGLFTTVFSSLSYKLFLILGIAFLIGQLESWSIMESFYYCVITMTTVGYGDVYPEKEISKVLSIIFIPLATAVTGHYISYIANHIIDGRQAKFRKELLDSIKYMNIEQLQILDKNGDKEVKKIDYFEFMLKAMNKIDEKLWKKLSDQFDEIDKNKDGILTMKELQDAAKKQREYMQTQNSERYRTNLWSS